MATINNLDQMLKPQSSYMKARFTWNNYEKDEQWHYKLKSAFDKYGSYLVYGKEEESTKHLQGFMKFSKKVKGQTIINAMKGAHFFVAMASDKANRRYCLKGSMKKDAYEACVKKGKAEEHPTFGIGYEGEEWGVMEPEQVETNHQDAQQSLMGHWTPTTTREKGEVLNYANIHEDLWKMNSWAEVILNPQFQNHLANSGGKALMQEIFDLKPKEQKPFPFERKQIWQAEFLKIIGDPVHDRHIHFWIDKDGNSGKSKIAKWLHQNGTAYYLSGGKDADMAYALKDFKGLRVIIDLPRKAEGFFPWGFVEKIKNGSFFTSKWGSKTLCWDSCLDIHITMNWEPPMDAFSKDRYKLHYITDAKRQ